MSVSYIVSVSDSNIVSTFLALQMTYVVPSYADSRHVMVKSTYV